MADEIPFSALHWFPIHASGVPDKYINLLKTAVGFSTSTISGHLAFSTQLASCCNPPQKAVMTLVYYVAAAYFFLE